MATTTTNENAVKLNFRGKARQFGVRTLNTAMTSGKQSFMIIGVTLVLFVLFTIINPNFAGNINMLTMVRSLVPYAVLGLGVTFVIATGGIDLSIGTVCIGSAVMAGSICNVSAEGALLGLTIPLMMIFGLLFGILNGVLIAKFKLPPFIATLGTMMFSRGFSALIANIIAQKSSDVKYPAISWMQTVFSNANGFPIGIVWLIALTIICMFVMYKTKVGRYILAIGSNEEAARLSGINVNFYKIVAYAIGGLFAGIAAIFWVSTNPSITPSTGNGMELDAIAGVYIGGTSTLGGSASIVGTVFGALVLVVIRQGLNVLLSSFSSNISSIYITYLVTGIIVVFAVLMDILKTKAAAKVKLSDTADKCKTKYLEARETLLIKNDYILSDKSLSAEERQAQSQAVKAELAQLRETFKAEYAECKKVDAKIIADAKLARQSEKEALKAQRAEEKSKK